MQTYSQNARFKIESFGFSNQTIVDTINSLPIDGYTIEYINLNFKPIQLNELLINLGNAYDDVVQVQARWGSGGNFNPNGAATFFLNQLKKDLLVSINNVNTILVSDKDDIILPTPKPIISVTGVTFTPTELGDGVTLPIKIENKGDAELVITGYTGFGVGATYGVISPSNWPTITPDSANTLKVKPNESRLLDILFSPNAVEEYTVNVVFTSNASEGTNTAVIKAQGKEISDPGIETILGKKKVNTKRVLTLKNVREVVVKTKNNPDINSPYFDQELTTHGAKIVADIYQCYIPYGQENQVQAKLLEGVVIASGIGSFWYERCDDFLGGLKPSYQYFYDTEDINDILSWKPLTNSDVASLLPNQSGVIDVTNIDQLFKFRSFITKIQDELDTNDSYWGKFDSQNPNKTICEIGNVTDKTYLFNVVRKHFLPKSNVKIYGGFRENFQNRKSGILDEKLPDLISAIEGNSIKTIDSSFISINAYGRLNCLQPKTGCYITGEQALNDIRAYGGEIIKLVSKSTLPEKIPDHPCYRGYKTTYIRSFNWERRWEVILDCLGVIYTEYEWRPDENLFNERGYTYDVWEDVEFAGTEIGFSDNCIPIERPKVQEPYVDMSDNLGCYELQTTKIYMKYSDYNSPGDRDYIRGPEVLSIQNYSGLGPGIKLNRKVKRADCDQSPIRIFHPLKMGSDIITGRDNLITKGLFNGNQSPGSYNTSSLQNVSSKKYIYNIVDNTVLKNNVPISYFSVAYGNKNGSGSVYTGYEVNDSTTKAIYSQNRLLALDSNETEFTTYTSGSVTSGKKDVYVINFNRDSLSDRLDPGNFEISLCELTNSPSKVMTFIDNSTDLLENNFSNDYIFSSFDIVSGSLENGIHDSGTGSIESNIYITTYGKIYPALGIVVFDADKLDEQLQFGTNRSENVDTNNSIRIFNSITGAAELGYNMKARGSSNKKSNHYFVRVSAGICNYSNNPTMVNDILTDNNVITLTNNNVIKHEFFKYNPVTYITTVGLYNDAEELLAVAKLSRPVKKTPEADILIKIRLNW